MAKQVKIPMPVPLKRSLPLDGPHKKRVYVVSGIVLAVVLIIVALVVTIVLATTGHAQDHDQLLDSSTKRLPEVLTIAFNIGYQNESTKNSVDKSKKYVLKLANLLDFSANSLTVNLVPYSDDVDVRFKCSSAKEIADIVAKIEGKSLKGKNPSQKNVVDDFDDFHESSNETSDFVKKFCLFAPSTKAYVDSVAVEEDAKETGKKINKIVEEEGILTAVVALVDDLSAYGFNDDDKLVVGTLDDLEDISQRLNPDPVLPEEKLTTLQPQTSTAGTTQKNRAKEKSFSLMDEAESRPSDRMGRLKSRLDRIGLSNFNIDQIGKISQITDKK